MERNDGDKLPRSVYRVAIRIEACDEGSEKPHGIFESRHYEEALEFVNHLKGGERRECAAPGCGHTVYAPTEYCSGRCAQTPS